MTDSFIEVARDGAIATLTINRPEKRNAITNEMMEELERVAKSFAGDEKTRAIIIRAEGNDFSVGADLSQPRFQGDPQSMLMRRRGLEQGSLTMRAFQEIHQPTICAMNWIKILLHFKTALFVMSPPACKSWQIGIKMMLFVNETT